jgi:hypothetical protein
MTTSSALSDIAAVRTHVQNELGLGDEPEDNDPYSTGYIASKQDLDEFPDETVAEMFRILTLTPSSKVREQLRRYCNNGRSDRIMAACRYYTLFLEGVPDIADPADALKVMIIPERHGRHVSGSIALARRVGMAHAVLALLTAVMHYPRAYSSERQTIRSLDADEVYLLLEEKYPVLVDTFAQHIDQAPRLHAFLAERGYVISADMFDVLKTYAESPATALSEGVL